MAKTYQVRVTNSFRAITTAARQTAGLTIDVTGDGYIGELTDEQLTELENDRYVLVTEPSEAEAATVKSRVKAAGARKARAAKNTEAAKADVKADTEGRETKEIVAGTPGPVAKA